MRCFLVLLFVVALVTIIHAEDPASANGRKELSK